MNTTNSALIDLKNLSYAYPGGKPIFQELDFALHPGDRIGLIAPNGSGKTTLFHLIMGLLKPDSGTLHIFGKPTVTENDFRHVRRKIGLLFQDSDDQLFSPTVLEDVAFGPLNLGKSKQEAIDVSMQTLEFLGLNGFEERVTFKLSGGEKRLVALATVLAMEPEVLLLDEPSAGLDETTKEKLVQILKQLDVTYLIVSHEFEFITEVTDRIYTLQGGSIHLDSETIVHRHTHAHIYGAQPHKH